MVYRIDVVIKKDSGMSSVKYNIIKIIAAITLLTGLYLYISPEAIAEAFSTMDVRWLLVALCLSPLFLGCRLFKWLLLIRQGNSEIRFVEIVPSYLRGMFVGLFTPLRLGEATRAIGSGDAPKQFALYIVEKLLEVVILLILCTLALIGYYSKMMWVLVPLFLLFLISRTLLSRICIGCIHLTNRIFHKPPSNELASVEKEIRGVRYGGCAIFSICVFVIFMVQVYIIMLGFGVEVSPSALLRFPIVLLGNALPITVGGFGVREAAAVVLLKSEGISAAVAASSFSIVAIMDLILPAFLGALFLIFKSKSKENEERVDTETGVDAKDWDVFWQQRDRRLSGRIISWVRCRYVTPKLVSLVMRSTQRGTLLEAGCGTGEVALQTAKIRGDRVVLVDKSKKALNMAQRKSEEMGIDARVLLCDIADLSSSLQNEENVTAFNVGVIEHFIDCSEILNEMSNVSDKSALAVIPESSIFWRVFVGITSKLGLVPDDFFIKLYTKNGLRSVVEGAGLNVIEMNRVRIFGVIPYLGVSFGNLAEKGGL